MLRSTEVEGRTPRMRLLRMLLVGLLALTCAGIIAGCGGGSSSSEQGAEAHEASSEKGESSEEAAEKKAQHEAAVRAKNSEQAEAAELKTKREAEKKALEAQAGEAAHKHSSSKKHASGHGGGGGRGRRRRRRALLRRSQAQWGKLQEPQEVIRILGRRKRHGKGRSPEVRKGRSPGSRCLQETRTGRSRPLGDHTAAVFSNTAAIP